MWRDHDSPDMIARFLLPLPILRTMWSARHLLLREFCALSCTISNGRPGKLLNSIGQVRTVKTENPRVGDSIDSTHP
jgi:hypothetical protein